MSRDTDFKGGVEYPNIVGYEYRYPTKEMNETDPLGLQSGYIKKPRGKGELIPLLVGGIIAYLIFKK